MVLGHFFSVGNKFIYVFHVPLFFVISGYLLKKESDPSVFWKKLWYNLMVPMLLMIVIKFSITCIVQLVDGSFELMSIYWFLRNVLFGMVSGFGVLWFVYTLIIQKTIFQFCSSKISFYVFVLVMLSLAYVYNHLDTSNYPFF
jgi:Acyltransferase family.